MKTNNIGLANLCVSNSLQESYLEKNKLYDAKDLTLEFFQIIKKSPILQLEYKVFNNLKNKHINNDVLATRYIDNNIKLFEIYTTDEIINENKKISKFVDENILNRLDKKNVNLFESIHNLIIETIKDYEDIDVDKIHESFDVILNHIKTNENEDDINNKSKHVVSEDIIKIAVDKFNEKYSKLSENEIKLFKKLTESTVTEKEKLLNQYKTLNIDMLNSIKSNGLNDKIMESVKKIESIEYDSKNIDRDIINLFKLNSELNEEN